MVKFVDYNVSNVHFGASNADCVASDGDLDASNANFHAVNTDCDASAADLML